MQVNTMIFILSAVMLMGCEAWSLTDGDKFEKMCNDRDSMICNIPAHNTAQPDTAYLKAIERAFLPHIIYTDEANDVWSHNDTVYEVLRGDCEDLAFTFANQLLLDGVSPEYIYIVFSKGGGKAHIHVSVIASDGVYEFNPNNDLEEFKRVSIDNIKGI